MPLTRRVAAIVVALAAFASGCRKEFAGRIVEPARAAPDVGALRFADQRDKVVVLAFGFARCTDVCPLTLSRMQAAYALLGDEASRVTMAFVGVDPERDAPGDLRDYVAMFDPRITPVHVEGAALGRALDGYGAAARSHRPGAGDVTVEHTAGLFVSDKLGRLRLFHRQDARPEALVADIRRLLAER